MGNAQMEGGSNRLPGWSVAPIFGPKKCHKVPMRDGVKACQDDLWQVSILF